MHIYYVKIILHDISIKLPIPRLLFQVNPWVGINVIFLHRPLKYTFLSLALISGSCPKVADCPKCFSSSESLHSLIEASPVENWTF